MGIAPGTVKRSPQGKPQPGLSHPAARPAREEPTFYLPSRACEGAVLWLGSRAPDDTGPRMHAVLHLILLVIRIYIWILIAQAILSWLLAFGVINRYNRAVSVIGDFLYRVTEPALRPIRALLPNFGGIDISPIILILILYFISDLIVEDIAPYLL